MIVYVVVFLFGLFFGALYARSFLSTSTTLYSYSSTEQGTKMSHSQLNKQTIMRSLSTSTVRHALFLAVGFTLFQSIGYAQFMIWITAFMVAFWFMIVQKSRSLS